MGINFETVSEEQVKSLIHGDEAEMTRTLEAMEPDRLNDEGRFAFLFALTTRSLRQIFELRLELAALREERRDDGK